MYVCTYCAPNQCDRCVCVVHSQAEADLDVPIKIKRSFIGKWSTHLLWTVLNCSNQRKCPHFFLCVMVCTQHVSGVKGL